MRKLVFWGTALAIIGTLLFSCNKNRFDLDHLESVQGSGQWKLPIGSMRVTLEEVFDQLGDNDLISYDENGNLQLRYEYINDEILKGTDFLNLGSLNFDFQMHLQNPHQGEVIMEPFMDTLRFSQVISIALDSAGMKTAVVKTGEMMMRMETNLGEVSNIIFSSSGVIMPNGDTLACYFNQLNGNTVDLSGATFQMNTDPVTGLSDSTLTFNYQVHYIVNGFDLPDYDLTTQIGLNNVKIKEITGYVNSFVYDFSYDTAFNLPLANIEGEMELIGVDLQIKEKNTFGFDALFQIDQAELFGEGVAPSPIFPNYPYCLEVLSTPEYTNVFPEDPLNLRYSTDFNGVRVASKLIINPGGGTRLIRINDDSSMGIGVDAVIPFQFNIPHVSYLDTIDIDVSDINAPDLVKEIVLGIIFQSEMPFNFDAQFYTIDEQTGRITDSLMADPLRINGSFDGKPVNTTADISITQSRVNSLMAANKLIMRLGVNSQNQNVFLNLANGLGVTLKADVIYDGQVEVGKQ